MKGMADPPAGKNTDGIKQKEKRDGMYAPKTFATPEEAKTFVADSERHFHEEIVALSETIVERCMQDALRCISLTGPTCAGKTTAAALLTEELSRKGLGVCTVSVDDFYLDRCELRSSANGQEADYDSVDTIDLSALAATVSGLRRGGEVCIPIYDFKKQMRTGYRYLHADNDLIFLFEGIQTLYPAVAGLLSEGGCLPVGINTQSGIESDSVSFAPEEIRLYRRLVRDHAFRSSDAGFTLSLWQGVRRNEVENILPHFSLCHRIVDSTHAYEMNLLAPYLRQVLTEVPADSPFAEQARAICEKIQGFGGVYPGYLNADSLYWEFLKKETETGETI